MKTLIEIQNDYNGSLSSELRNEDITYLVNKLDIFCEIRNNKFVNLIEKHKNYVTYEDEYSNNLVVYANGYSQNEWQEYTIYYNNYDDNLKRLVSLLENTFTHQNGYILTKYEFTEIDGKIFKSEPIDYTSFCINHIEFPDEQDVINEYNCMYGIDYDKYIVNID